MTQGVLQTYREFLPITPATPMITLGEGDTPLVRSHRLAEQLGLENLYFKLEGSNPTGSFKDRGMVMAVANAIEHDSKTLICASTGNTSASAAAYGAHCNLSTVVLVPKGNVARGKIAQAIAYGANILVINGNFDQARRVRRASSLASLSTPDFERPRHASRARSRRCRDPLRARSACHRESGAGSVCCEQAPANFPPRRQHAAAKRRTESAGI